MLKLVLDTNTLVSAFFWKGNEYDLFKEIEQGKVRLFISKEILDEVGDVLNRDKFKDILEGTNQNADEIVQKIISLSHLVIGKRLNIEVNTEIKQKEHKEVKEEIKEHKKKESSFIGYKEDSVKKAQELLKELQDKKIAEQEKPKHKSMWD